MIDATKAPPAIVGSKRVTNVPRMRSRRNPSKETEEPPIGGSAR